MIKLNGIILFVLICITSCTKKTEDATDVSSIASDDGFAENIIYDLKNAGDQAGTYELNPSIKSFEKSSLSDNDKNDNIILKGTGNVKHYNTDWLIFQKGKTVLIFNKKPNIIGGNFVFPKDGLLYDIK